MTLQIHHVFVCASAGAPEAEAVLQAGLVEGSPNKHPGQGTANRRFFFRRGYLELLWVHDQDEARSDISTPTRLWDRWSQRGGSANPFGLCFSSSKGLSRPLPFTTWTYRPSYLPRDRAILFADQQPLSEPEIFLLNWPQDQRSPESEPRNHPLGLIGMRSVSVGLSDPGSASATLRTMAEEGSLKIHQSAGHELVLEFISEQELECRLPTLGLILIGQPG